MVRPQLSRSYSAVAKSQVPHLGKKRKPNLQVKNIQPDIHLNGSNFFLSKHAGQQLPFCFQMNIVRQLKPKPFVVLEKHQIQRPGTGQQKLTIVQLE